MYIGFEDFQDRSRDFCFSSFLTKPEIIKIIVQVKTRQIQLSIFHILPKFLCSIPLLKTKTELAKTVEY